ncbi:signal peptidase I [Cellulomonas citrea]|uniref:signal peptidase I n=1 Tax=Cellulomonas citrea TaxID=1909423 RepID=UPI001358B8AF|nr:signal peptidase I [Cellulomonas citrea]
MSRSAAHAVRGEPFGRRALRAAPTVLLYLLGAFAVWFVWPTSLGGCTTITIVSGHSMEPTLHSGDLVLSRCGQAKVGDIVIYAPPGMDRSRVIHRVVGGDGATGWTMRGDNNAWVDPFTPTEDRVVGIARFRVPGLGLATKVLVNPWVWVSVLVLAGALLVWPSRTRTKDVPDDATSADPVPADAVPAVPSPADLELADLLPADASPADPSSARCGEPEPVAAP